MNSTSVDGGIVANRQLEQIQRQMVCVSRYADRMVLHTILHTKPYIDNNFAVVYASNYGIELTKDTIGEFITSSKDAMHKSYYESIVSRMCNIYERLQKYSMESPLLVTENVSRIFGELLAIISNDNFGYDDVREKIQGLRNTLTLDDYRSDLVQNECPWTYGPSKHHNKKLVHMCCQEQAKLINALNPVHLKELRGTLRVSGDQWIEFYGEAMEAILMLYTGGNAFPDLMDNAYKYYVDLTDKSCDRKMHGIFQNVCPFETAKRIDQWSCVHPSALLCTKTGGCYRFCCKDKGPRRRETELLAVAMLMYEDISNAYKAAKDNPTESSNRFAQVEIW